MSRFARTPPALDVLACARRVAELQAGAALALRPAPSERDAAGRRRTPQQCSGYRRGQPPANKGHRYPPTPPTVSECMAMLRACGPSPADRRLAAAIILLWQGALRAFEALAIVESDLDEQSGRIHIRHGKGDKAATIKMSAWAWPLLAEWRTRRAELPDPRGPLICVVDGSTAGHAWGTSNLRTDLRALADGVGIHHRVAPHQLRHAWAVQAYEAGMPIRAIQIHLRHAHLGVTDTYLQGLGVDESHDRVYQQAEPTVPATALLELTGLAP